MVVIAKLDKGLGIVRGDKFPIRRYLTGIPTGQTVTRAWLTVKLNKTDLDAAAIFQKEIVVGTVVDVGEIEDAGGTGVATLRFDLTAVNTRAMTAGERYYYDMQVLLSGGNVRTFETGEVGSVLAEIGIDDA